MPKATGVHKIVVFDLDETLGCFIELGIFWDSLQKFYNKKLSNEEWELMNKAERTEWKLQISNIHEDNAKMQSKRESLTRKLDMARSLRGETTC